MRIEKLVSGQLDTSDESVSTVAMRAWAIGCNPHKHHALPGFVHVL